MENVDFSPSGAVFNRSWGIGRIFYVDGLDGDDGNNGRDPATPFKTIAFALTLCNFGANLKGWNDYIIVFNHWQETVPIVINKKRVHIIGVGYPGRPMVVINASINEPIFEVEGDDGDFCEIAGFELGGGNNHAAIEAPGGVGTADFVYIHDCNFGSEYCGNTPRDGIWSAGGGGRSWRIERCKFMGNHDVAGGVLSRDGIRIEGGHLCHTEIVDCVFLACLVGINVDSSGILIKNNEIALYDNIQGAGITLGAGANDCIVTNNRAAYGKSTPAMTNNPYLDSAVGGVNHWVANYVGNGETDPD